MNAENVKWVSWDDRKENLNAVVVSHVKNHRGIEWGEDTVKKMF